MAETPYKGYALYEPDASPDLTESGEYNSALMAVDADMHDEEQARIEGDTALNIAIANEMAQRKASDDALNGRVDTETAERKAADAALDTAYKAADTALGKRIDNAEVEISANSADLTGIKSLTYGEQHVNFLENSNGEYSSPALDEIAEQINQGFAMLTIMQLSEFGELTDNTGATHSAIGDGNDAAYAKLKQAWPSVIVVEGGTSWRCGMYTPSAVEQAGYILVKSASINDSTIQMRIHGGGFSGAITLEEIGR